LTGDVEIAQLLIDNGVKVSRANENELTPSHQDIGWTGASDAMATLLIHAGAGASRVVKTW
jgi:hypothetical protein